VKTLGGEEVGSGLSSTLTEGSAIGDTSSVSGGVGGGVGLTGENNLPQMSKGGGIGPSMLAIHAGVASGGDDKVEALIKPTVSSIAVHEVVSKTSKVVPLGTGVRAGEGSSSGVRGV